MIYILCALIVYGFIKNRKLIFRKGSLVKECSTAYMIIIHEIECSRSYSEAQKKHDAIMTWFRFYQGRVPGPILDMMYSNLRRKFLDKTYKLHPRTI